MTRSPFEEKFERTRREGRRVVAPLIGFPGINIVQSSIKLAQQNFGEHFRVLKAIAETFEPDVMFPLMDLAVEANALGYYTLFPQAESATVVRTASCLEELERISQVNIAFDSRLLGYIETMKMMSLGLPDTIVKGAYVTGPYTLAALMMGADEAAMATVLRQDELHVLCQFTTERILEYVRLLIAAGAQAICILEPSAVMMGPDQFAEFSAAYVRHIIQSCKYTGITTIYHTCGNTMHLVNKMVESGVNAISLDSPDAGVDLPGVAAKVPQEVIIMGNISPDGAVAADGAIPELRVEHGLRPTAGDTRGEHSCLHARGRPCLQVKIIRKGCLLPNLTSPSGFGEPSAEDAVKFAIWSWGWIGSIL